MRLSSAFISFEIDGDLSPLIEAVRQMTPEQWDAWEYRQQMFAVHKATKSFPFIWSGNEDPRMATVLHNQDTALWDLVKPVVSSLESRFAGRATKAMLAKLPASKSIAPHADGAQLQVIHRIHVPLVTAPDVVFTVSGIDYHLPIGMAYELSNVEVHSVQNSSEVDRIHLMVDILGLGNKRLTGNSIEPLNRESQL